MHQGFVHARIHQIFFSSFFVEHPCQIDDGIVIDGGDKIGIPDIMDPGHVFVANTFNAMRTKTIFQQGRALLGFTRDNFDMREFLFQIIACSQRSGRACGGGKSSQSIPGSQNLVSHIFQSVSSEDVVPDVIAKFIELIEDHQVLTTSAKFPTLIEDLFDIGFCARSGDDFISDGPQPIKALPAHAFWQNRDRMATQQPGIIRAAPAIVAS